MPQELVFDSLVPEEVPVTIDKDRFILREALEEDVVWWQSEQFKNAKVSKGSATVSGLGGMAERESLLLSRCLFRADPEGRLPLNSVGEPDRRMLVAKQNIKGWPTKVVKKLFKTLADISGLNDEVQTGETDTPTNSEESEQGGQESNGGMGKNSRSSTTPITT